VLEFLDKSAAHYEITEHPSAFTAQNLAADMIAPYKKQPLMPADILQRLYCPFEDNRMALQCVTPDGLEAVVFTYSLGENPPGNTPTTCASGAVKLRGLGRGCPNAKECVWGTHPEVNYFLSGDRRAAAYGETLRILACPGSGELN